MSHVIALSGRRKSPNANPDRDVPKSIDITYAAELDAADDDNDDDDVELEEKDDDDIEGLLIMISLNFIAIMFRR